MNGSILLPTVLQTWKLLFVNTLTQSSKSWKHRGEQLVRHGGSEALEYLPYLIIRELQHSKLSTTKVGNGIPGYMKVMSLLWRRVVRWHMGYGIYSIRRAIEAEYIQTLMLQTTIIYEQLFFWRKAIIGGPRYDTAESTPKQPKFKSLGNADSHSYSLTNSSIPIGKEMKKVKQIPNLPFL